jgi:hypothetical protein
VTLSPTRTAARHAAEPSPVANVAVGEPSPCARAPLTVYWA